MMRQLEEDEVFGKDAEAFELVLDDGLGMFVCKVHARVRARIQTKTRTCSSHFIPISAYRSMFLPAYLSICLACSFAGASPAACCRQISLP